MIDLNITKQQQSIRSILNDINEVGKKIDFEITVDESSFILLPTALSPILQEDIFKDNASNPDQVDEKITEKGACERNVTFSKSIKKLKTRILRDTVLDLASRDSVKAPFANALQWVGHVKAVWDAVQFFGDLFNFNTLKDYYDRNDLGRITQEIVKDILEQLLMSEATAKMNEMLSVGGSEESMRRLTTAALKEKERNFIHFVDTLLQPKYKDLLKEAFVNRVKDLRISEALKKEYNDALGKALTKMCNTALQEFQNKKSRDLIQIAIQDAIDDVRLWIDSKVVIDNAREKKIELLELFDSKWIEITATLKKQLFSLRPTPEVIRRDLLNDFSSVARAVPGLNVIMNQIGTSASQESVVEMCNALDPRSDSFSQNWFEIMKKQYIVSSARWYTWKKIEDTRLPCKVVLESISDLVASIRERQSSKPWDSSTIQGTIVNLDNIIKDVDEHRLGSCGYHFRPSFYSTWYVSLPHRLHYTLIS